MRKKSEKRWFVRNVITITLLSVISLSSCGNSEPAAAIFINESDVTSIAITPIEILGNQRIVALANGSAELINAMGYHANLVGRDIASTTAELKDIPIVTSGHQVIPETIIALHPTLVIIDSSTGPQSAISKIANAGIKIASVTQSWNMKDVAKKISELGIALGAPKTAQLLNYKIEMSSVSLSAKSKPRNLHPNIAFLYLRGTSSIYLVGGKGSGADFLIAAAGGVDVGAKALAHPFNPLSAETMATLNPDIILVMSAGLESVGGIDGLRKLPGVAQTLAGKNGNVVAVDDSLLLSFGPRTPSLIEKLTDAFSSVN